MAPRRRPNRGPGLTGRRQRLWHDLGHAQPSMMSPDPAAAAPHHHGWIKHLFNAVCDLPTASAQRSALQSLGADSHDQAEVLRLLAPPGGAARFTSSVADAAVQWLGSQVRPGDRLGAWTLLRPLGEGGMGRVFLAERSDGHYQQQAAIKLLLGWSGTEALARLRAERQILARLNHAHIAKLLDGGSTPAGQPYLVMEYAAGDSIDGWCQRQQAPLPARLALLVSICDAVAHAHRHGVIHCDIKPANVLVNAEGRVMLLDFGIARLEGQCSELAVGMTAGYASPEQVAGLATGPASDIFSLGRLLAELLRPLASGPQHPALAAIVARATAHDASRRYDSASALQQALQALLWPGRASALGRGVARWRQGLRQHRRWLLVAALGLVLGLTSALVLRLAWQLAQSQQAEQRARQAETQALEQAWRAQQAEGLARQALAAERAAARKALEDPTRR